jgi:hypothetical protein
LFRIDKRGFAPQALEQILEDPETVASLSVLRDCLPKHAAAILNHKNVDSSSCPKCSGNEHSECAASTPCAVLHALNRTAASASYGQLQELLLRLLQLAAAGQQCREAESASLAVSSMCYSAVNTRTRNR